MMPITITAKYLYLFLLVEDIIGEEGESTGANRMIKNVPITIAAIAMLSIYT
jgi:hypothetical protein